MPTLFHGLRNWVPVIGGGFGGDRSHKGLDGRTAGVAPLPIGTPVYAHSDVDGVVTSVRSNDSTYGNFVKTTYIFGGHTYTIMDAHLKKVLVREGQRVNYNTQLAESGNSGNVIAHLHEGLWIDGVLSNPAKYLNLRPVGGPAGTTPIIIPEVFMSLFSDPRSTVFAPAAEGGAGYWLTEGFGAYPINGDQWAAIQALRNAPLDQWGAARIPFTQIVLLSNLVRNAALSWMFPQIAAAVDAVIGDEDILAKLTAGNADVLAKIAGIKLPEIEATPLTPEQMHAISADVAAQVAELVDDEEVLQAIDASRTQILTAVAGVDEETLKTLGLQRIPQA